EDAFFAPPGELRKDVIVEIAEILRRRNQDLVRDDEEDRIRPLRVRAMAYAARGHGLDRRGQSQHARRNGSGELALDLPPAREVLWGENRQRVPRARVDVAGEEQLVRLQCAFVLPALQL